MNVETCKTRPTPTAPILAPSDQSVPDEWLSATLGSVAPCLPPTSQPSQLSLSHQIRVKSAELWLMLGEADEAVRELEVLPTGAWNHPSAVKVRIAALETLQERTGAVVQI